MILRGFLTGIALASCIQPLIASEAGPTLASRQQIETGLCLTHKLRYLYMGQPVCLEN